MTTIGTERIINKGEKYFKQLQTDDNGRYKSWEHCYCAFAKYKGKKKLTDENVDFLCLHLAFYLASWGMYRGSSFLLQKDYMVHANAVLKLVNYTDLWGAEYKDHDSDDKIEQLFELTEELRKIYCPIRKSVRIKKIEKSISDVLISKILLGTLGCTPAYDEYFVKGVRSGKVASGTFSHKSISELTNFYNDKDRRGKLEEWKREISRQRKVTYPQMKILDMCFWQIGFDRSKNK